MVLLITKTDFQYGGAGDLLRYISRDNDQEVPVKDHTGRELDQNKRSRFVDVSEQYGMERHIIVAPDPKAEYSASEVDRNVRSLMREWREARKRTHYVYAVHDSQETPHAHVAVTGREQQLYMDREDIESFRERAGEVFKEPQRLAQRQVTSAVKRSANRDGKHSARRHEPTARKREQAWVEALERKTDAPKRPNSEADDRKRSPDQEAER
ncbi:hypothetical protein [Haloarchaeobius sp. DFWS5]|uniref:hypothetical protein n=1 Tax=Haloarchaeobius sp. DFWS5 TaxID=3446114 RepID=UPI003EB8BBBE